MRLNWHSACSSKLMVTTLLLCGSACILPPPIDEESPGTNRPPVIDPTQPTRDGEPIRLDCNGQGTNFTANIDDENERDTLYYRFFIDYFRLEPEDILDVQPVRQPPRATGTRFASLSPALTINNSVLLERPTDVHVVELLVADRAFDDANPDIDPSSIGRVPITGGLTASYSWTVYPIECD